MTLLDEARRNVVESFISELAPRRAAPRRGRRAASAPRRGRTTRAGDAKRARLVAWLRVAPSGLSVAELAALVGISRQLCLYHMKRLVATSRAGASGVTAVLEPCARNGQTQYRVWDAERLTEAVLTRGAGAWRVETEAA